MSVDAFRKVGAIFVLLVMSAPCHVSAAGLDKPNNHETYGDWSIEKRERFRSTMKDEGLTDFQLCRFEKLCDGGLCENSGEYGEMATRIVATSEGLDDDPDLSTFTGMWIGPEGLVSRSGAILGEVLTGMGPGIDGDLVSVLSIDMDTGNARLTVHGTQDLWSHTYFGSCEVIE